MLDYLVRRFREREYDQAREYLLEHDFDVDALMLKSIDHYVEVFRHFGICDLGARYCHKKRGLCSSTEEGLRRMSWPWSSASGSGIA